MIIGNPDMFPELQIEDALERMKSLGFSGVEISSPMIDACTTTGLKRQFADYVASLDLRLVRLNTAGADYFTPLGHPGEASRILEALKADIDVAEIFGVEQLTTWEGRPHTGVSKVDVNGWVLDATTRLFEQATEYTRPRNIHLSIEPHPRSLGMDVEWLKRLCDRVDRQLLSVTYDCAHFGVGLPEDYVEAARVLSGSIGHFDFCDSDLDTTDLHLAPGTGSLDLDAIVEALRDGAFKGTCKLDLYGCLLPIEGARTGIPTIRSAMEKLGVS